MTDLLDAAGIARALDALNHEYVRLHTAKEDAFWTAYMGLAGDSLQARARLSEAEIRLSSFLNDPERLAQVRAWTARAEALLDAPDPRAHNSAEDFSSLAGWLATFEAHVIENPSARALSEELIEREGQLALARAQLQLQVTHADGTRQPASSVRLGNLVANDPHESVRRSAFEGLRSIETHLLEHGILDLVRMRNRWGRLVGGEDWYDGKVRRVEGQSKAELFLLLEELEARTQARAQESLHELAQRRGAQALEPWNVRYESSGDLSAAQDPYYPFEAALERWMQSFAQCGVDFAAAQLVLDLVDRPGKYENGFMHGPVPAWTDRGRRIPARIQFTANAIPGLLGAGRRALDTLFHEGGHAAHFANIDMPAPCFAQEFAPTSVGFAETQSMLMESMVQDPTWQQRYARTLAGEPMPQALILRGVETAQPFAAWNLRAMLCVCFAERALYEIPDAQLSAARVLEELRAVERKVLGLAGGSPRPVLSVPHLASNESSAYYHGYVLAAMAVEQTRAYFTKRDGGLIDNPRLGPTLREHYWQPGNSLGFSALIENLTGNPLGAQALAERANQSVAQAREAAQQGLAAAPAQAPLPLRLGADVRVVHGSETITSGADGQLERMGAEFARWISARSHASKAP